MDGGRRKPRRRSRAPWLFAAAIALGAALPAVGNAFASRFPGHPVSLAARGGLGSFTPASVDPQLFRAIAARALGRGSHFRFTPAGSDAAGAGRAVTVVVRVDHAVARAISVRSVLAGAGEPGAAPARLSPAAYNLGLARGYDSFALDTARPAEPKPAPGLGTPDLRAYRLGAAPGASGDAGAAPSRFAPRIEMDEHQNPGRAPRTIEGQGEARVDVGGSYRLSRNLNVTAGLRYSEKHDLRALTDTTKDSQAVYVGTQFRF